MRVWEIVNEASPPINDPKFVGFMNKTLGNRVDAPAPAPDPDIVKMGGSVAELDNPHFHFRQAINFGIKLFKHFTPEQKLKLAKKGQAAVEEYIYDMAVRHNMLMNYDADGTANTGKFAEEDIAECQGYLPEIFHDPAIDSWLMVLTDGRPIAEPRKRIPKDVSPFTVKINQIADSHDEHGRVVGSGLSNKNWKPVKQFQTRLEAETYAKQLISKYPNQYIGITNGADTHNLNIAYIHRPTDTRN
jgi:hypothetical protein